ncbi:MULTISPECIES: hypothetical protein [unclassified Duganella]|uniref:hypothetical protein n=1 Tax=unclassified Duganella TaxID=2636909 RepID=UPI0006F4C497|nr:MULTISPECIES: hypothetical protein [unclassified Duganella]KQV47484.1 hypothetical protein ASD07_11095 [Duganella sp. Root336D2]KRC00100.1 hypothetical protein ASE26_24040 [Duganella sp. Root198D2]
MSRKLVSVQIPSALFLELASYLQEFGDERDPAEVVEAALASWLCVARGQMPEAEVRRYQWKRLFLPESTELKMSYRGTNAFAEVVGDSLVYQGQLTTPNQFVAEVAGTARNAWEVLWLRLPGQRYWKNARFIRNEILRGPYPAPLPEFRAHDTTASPAVMAHSLRNALVLIEKASTRRHGKMERRTDVLPDD